MKPDTAREILLIDDNPADLDLIRYALTAGGGELNVNTLTDGEQAILFLMRAGKFEGVPRPHLIILDLNLPRKDGRAVLGHVKSDQALRSIPIVLFTTSGSHNDISDCYALGANCYVSKPGSLVDFRQAVQSIAYFWLGVARVPE